ncbi:MAG: hypothetical protein ACK5XN_37045, partial [Bacteroidota bacterium]
EIEKVALVRNIFLNNFENLKTTSGLGISNIRIYEDFQKIEYTEQPGQMSEVIGIMGFPHNVINLTDGYIMFVYYGIHQCKIGKTCGVMMIKLNHFNQITSTYKYINICKCKVNLKDGQNYDYIKPILEIKENNIDFN